MDAGDTSPGMDKGVRSRSQSREQRMEQLPWHVQTDQPLLFAGKPAPTDQGLPAQNRRLLLFACARETRAA